MNDDAHRGRLGPAMVTLALAAITAVLAWLLIGPELARHSTGGYDIERMVLLYATLPRLATALICGAALALSGALFQQVLRNPLASPTTLGISAGANLALVIATLFIPGLLGMGRDVVALFGSAAAAGIVLGLGARRGFSPFSLILSGLVVSLWCGALAAILTLLNDRYLVSLFIWGSGSLAQQGWAVPLALSAKVGVVAVLCSLLVRPLALLELGDGGAAALGVRIMHLRILAIAAAVALAAFVTSAVGVIGFIGLVSPTLCRLAGARRPGELLVWSTLVGALLLLLADEAVQMLSASLSDFLPTGAVTAMFGAPLLLLLLPRLKIRHRILPTAVLVRRHAVAQRRIFALVAVASLGAILLGLMLGHGLDGRWSWLAADQIEALLPLRAPKVFASLAAGAMLAVAGVILQRLTGNEMASPEVLGVSAGATLGVTVGLFALTTTTLGSQLGFAAGGAFCVLAIIFLFAARSGFAVERVLLAGIALGSMVDAVVGVLSATGDPRALLLMRWMSGSTYAVDGLSALVVSIAAAVLIALALSARRWLDILPLGASAASLGLPLTLARLVLFALAGLLSAAATLTVGPLSFIGLMGPHLAREAGLVRALPQMAGAAAMGGCLMVIADWIGRSLVHPYEIPAGLVSALVGAPILMLMLRRKT